MHYLFWRIFFITRAIGPMNRDLRALRKKLTNNKNKDITKRTVDSCSVSDSDKSSWALSGTALSHFLLLSASLRHSICPLLCLFEKFQIKFKNIHRSPLHYVTSILSKKKAENWLSAVLGCEKPVKIASSQKFFLAKGLFLKSWTYMPLESSHRNK